MSVELAIWLLGGFRARVGSRDVPAADWRPRAAALVKLLALAPEHRLHREVLIERLWPDLESEAASNNLHRTLYLARRTLEPDLRPGQSPSFLLLRDDLVALSPSAPVQTDVDAFRRAASRARDTRDPADYRAALEQYGGDLLPEDRFADWAAISRDELRDLWLSLHVELAHQYERTGRFSAAIDTLRGALAADVAHEPAHVGLMRAYALSGDRHAALRQYQALRDALRQELAAKPDVASHRLYQDLLAHRFPPRAPVSAESAATAAPAPPAASPASAAPATNLPTPISSFIGRTAEIAEIRELLAETRLLTLTGAGGTGKTRLALRVAAEVAPRYPAGAWLVELADLVDPGLVAATAATVLGLPDDGARPPLDRLREHLRSGTTLLVLDNCEHLIAACVDLVAALLSACPNLTVLATSREALGLIGELAWHVPSLDLPPAHGSLTPDEALRFDAVRLFVERARLSRPGFRPGPENLAAVLQICRRLDGIPLAIELAAVRVKMLGVEQIAAKLDDALSVLTEGSRAALPRQRTLRAAFDWSYVLLNEAEQVLFRRLAVFNGGWSLDAAEGVAGDLAVLDLLTSLVDKSLVIAEVSSGVARYRFLEVVRQYAAEKLRAAGEEATLRRRHARWYAAFAGEAEAKLTGPEQGVVQERLEVEHDNLRAALSWAIEHGDPECGLRLGESLWQFWHQRGHLGEGARWLTGVLSLADDLPSNLAGSYANALNGAATLTFLLGDNARAIELYEKGIQVRREVGPTARTAAMLNNLSMVCQYTGDGARAQKLSEEALDLARGAGDQRVLGVSFTNLGILAKDQGQFERAAALIEQGLTIFRTIGDRRGAADLLNSLAGVALERGDYDRAIAQAEESLAIRRELGDQLGTSETLQTIGLAANQLGDDERASLVLEEVLRLSRELGDNWGIAVALGGLAELTLRRQDLDGAAKQGQESLALQRQLAYKQGVAGALLTLGKVALARGEDGDARRSYAESFDLAVETKNQRGLVAGLMGLAALAAMRGSGARAARLLGAAEAVGAAAGLTLGPVARAEREQTIQRARQGQTERELRSNWNAGRALPFDAALNEARSLVQWLTAGPVPPDAAAPDLWDRLSAREREIALLIAQGLTNRQIAATIGVAERTADTHVGAILKKLQITSRTQVADLRPADPLLPG